MKKILLYVVCASVAYTGTAQNNFMETITPSSSNPTIKMDCRLFDGNYNRQDDFVDVLAISGDCTVYDQDKKVFTSMRGNIYSIFSVQQQGIGAASDSAATVYASIDKKDKDAVTADAGGVLTFSIQRDRTSGQWKVVSNDVAPNGDDIYFKKLSFSTVGGTIGNRSFTKISNSGTNGVNARALVVEDISGIRSNKDLVGDTTDFKYPNQFTKKSKDRSPIPADKSVKRYQSLGWPVQIDLETGKVVTKVHRFGRGVTALANNGNAVYIAIGGNPSVLLQYSAYAALELTANLDQPSGDKDLGGDGGQLLSIYKQKEDGTGEFVPLLSAIKIDSVPALIPNDQGVPKLGKLPAYEQIFDSLMVIKEVALRSGATMFANIGDLAFSKDENGDDVLLITEKGIDVSGNAYNTGAAANSNLALHLQALDAKDLSTDKSFSDPYGRVLALGGFAVNTFAISSVLEGGVSANGTFFSNPNKLEIIADGVGEVILIKEDVPAISMGRNPSEITSYDQRINEMYALEANNSSFGQFNIASFNPYTIATVPVANLKLVMQGSNGSDLSANSVPLTNQKGSNGRTFDTYLTVVNAENGTDKSRILAVRNIYANPGVCIPLGILDNTQQSNKGFGVWPNPTKATIQTETPGNYTLLNLNGQEVMKVLNSNELDMTTLPKGMYYLKNQTGNLEKVVKE